MYRAEGYEAIRMACHILHYAAEEYDYTPTDAPPELELVEVAV